MGLATEMGTVRELVLVAKDLARVLALELANWCQLHSRPAASPDNQTRRLLPEHEALRIASQCCQPSRTWCHNEGKTSRQAALQCTHLTHQEFSTRREHRRLDFQLKRWEADQPPCFEDCTNLR